jgi:diguanylate cyclase (GGDEF)-like protein/PAS domain S-box-containing protein
MTPKALFPEDATSRIPPPRQLLVLALILTCLSTAASLLSAHSWNAGGVTLIWPTNGFLIGVLLCERRERWPVLLTVGFVVDFCINAALGALSWKCLYLAGCNMLEVSLAAFLLYRTISPRPDLTQRKQLLHFLLFGVVIAPAITSFIASFFLYEGPAGQTLSQLLFFQEWFTADALGIATLTPLYLAFRHREGFGKRTASEIISLFAMLIIITLIVFWQTKFPLLYLIMPFLLMMGVRLGLSGSASGLLLVAILGGFLTTEGHGPIVLSSKMPLAARELVFQLFVAVCMLMLYILEVVLAESTRLQKSLAASEARFRLLAETSRDIIVLSDLDGQRHYISPAVTEVLGWQPSELLGNAGAEAIHPDDIPEVNRLFEDCLQGKPPRVLPYRVKAKDGEYCWLETNPRLYLDPHTGEPAGFVHIARDITERRLAEEELKRAFLLLEKLASVDGLTGIANRRRFDEILDLEWRRSIREQTELSLLLLDVDDFKLYNDLNGHLSGDDCLRLIADTMQQVVTRAADLLARYGGEEFAVILPNTSRSGAIEMCRQILGELTRRQIPHSGSTHGIVTVSIGCATKTPDEKLDLTALLQAADAALYRAKALGRNRAEVAEMG